MKILFMGTSVFAVPSLEKLILSEHDVTGIVTQPDRPSGRGRKIRIGPVKELALKYNVPVHQPLSVKDENFINKISALKPDIIVVVAFGQLLPQSILEIPAYFGINLHASLLPAYRGAAPVNRAIMNGDAVTGVTVQRMIKKLDAGDIILQKSYHIPDHITAGELESELEDLGSGILLEAVNMISNNKVTFTRQEEARVTYAPKLLKEHGLIDWERSAEQVVNLIRGVNPRPGAFTFFNGKPLKIWAASVSGYNETSGSPG